ncbi:Ig-like domain-containing protein [Myxococcus sp. K15C18031901]|uniref:Ig-like domain-containing protein n=1 Tax=Myxococcus dinghuensis TaxID=2906761 RepID=UPI0020A6EAE7|nr:Ig-like domain-containing protein [Myxococcus dinghuensis]MCP3103846.1 Ig-like domain-containing protein [Myxococcus dinghuensis]
MTPRPSLSLLLVAMLTSLACIDIPDVAPPTETPDADGGSQPDGGITPDAGVEQESDFTLSVNPSEDSILQGSERSFTVSIHRQGGFTEAVDIQLASALSGISATPLNIGAGSTSGTLTLSVSTSTTAGATTVTVRGTSGTRVKETQLMLQIVALGDLSVGWIEPTDSTRYTRERASFDVRVEGGQPEQVELLHGSTLIHRWTEPPYLHDWDTSNLPEGTYEVTARAIRGGTTFTSLPRTIIVDRTAPRVESHLPAPGFATVSVHTDIEVTFSEPIQPSSLAVGEVRIVTGGGATLTVTPELSTDGRKLKLIPSQPLPAPSTIRVELGSPEKRVTDLAGNSLSTGSTWEFTVPAWLPLGGIISAHPGNTPAGQVVMKRGLNGLPVIAWSEFDGTTKNVHAARWNGSTWEMLGGAQSALPGPETHASEPALYADATGTMLLAWSEIAGQGLKRSTFVRRWGNNTWQSVPLLPISGEAEVSVDSPSITTTQAGAIILDVDVDNQGILTIGAFSLAPDAATWATTFVQIPFEQFNVGDSSVTRNGTQLYTVYSAYFDNLEIRGLVVLVNHRDALGAAPINRSPIGPSTDATIETNGNGEPSIAWVETAIGSTDGALFFTHWNGSAWETIQRISPQTSSNLTPSIAIGEDGNPVVAWSGFSAPERSIFVTRQIDGSWAAVGTPLSATTGIDSPAAKPAVIVGPDNVPIVAWQERDGTSEAIHVRRLNQ